MFCSAGYHLFLCLSEEASKLWLRLDLGGISVGLCGCYFPGAYYAFFCHQVSKWISFCVYLFSSYWIITFQNWQFVYMVLMFCLAVSSMVVQLHPQFLTAKWHLRFVYQIMCVHLGHFTVYLSICWHWYLLFKYYIYIISCHCKNQAYLINMGSTIFLKYIVYFRHLVCLLLFIYSYRRLFLYTALIFLGVIPIMHWIISNGGFNTPLVKVLRSLQ